MFYRIWLQIKKNYILFETLPGLSLCDGRVTQKRKQLHFETSFKSAAD